MIFENIEGMRIQTGAITVVDTEIGRTYEPKHHVVNVVRVLYRNNQKIEAIKFMRAEMNLALREAKRLCDVLGQSDGSVDDPYGSRGRWHTNAGVGIPTW